MGLFDNPSAKDISRKQEKELKGVTRDLDKDQRFLDSEEKKLQNEIQASLKRGDQASAKILAKQLIRLREQKSKNLKMKSNVTAAGYQAKAVASQATMSKAMNATTQSLQMTNQQMNMPQMQAMMDAYSKESAKMEMGTEIMDDAFDAVFEGDEAEESDIMNQIYDEIGIDMSSKLGNAPTKLSQNQAQSELTDAEIEAKMAALLGA